MHELEYLLHSRDTLFWSCVKDYPRMNWFYQNSRAHSVNDSVRILTCHFLEFRLTNALWESREHPLSWRIYFLPYQHFYTFLSDIRDCVRPSASSVAELSCVSGLMTVAWQTNITLSGDITSVPADLKLELNKRLDNGGVILSAVIVNRNPP